MSQQTFQIGKEKTQKSNVLLWRLPKRPVTGQVIVPKSENPKKPNPVFGRRTIPPVG